MIITKMPLNLNTPVKKFRRSHYYICRGAYGAYGNSMRYGEFMGKSTYKDFGSALIAYRNRPEGESEPVKTNWTIVPTNDNKPPEDYGFERSLRITPSVREIMANVDAGPTVRNDSKQIVRIGKLRFSDGTQTERAHCFGPDGAVIAYDATMPAGAMLGTRDKAEAQLGGKGYTQAQLERSNDYFAESLGTVAHRYLKRTTRRNGKSYSAEESRAMLAEAIANTKTMPKVTRYAPGLPCGMERAADAFVGMQKAKKGESGAIAWEDIASAKVQREIWEETLERLADDDIKTLDNAMAAGNLGDLGDYGHRRTRERKGMRRLRAANDNLATAMRKSA